MPTTIGPSGCGSSCQLAGQPVDEAGLLLAELGLGPDGHPVQVAAHRLGVGLRTERQDILQQIDGHADRR